MRDARCKRHIALRSAECCNAEEFVGDDPDLRSVSLSRGIPEKGLRVRSIVESQSLALLSVSFLFVFHVIQSNADPCSRQGEAGEIHDGAVARALPKRNET